MKKYNLIQVQGKDVVIDISQLFREEVLYVNATKLAKQFGKRLDVYWKSPETKEYYGVLNTTVQRELELVKTAKGKYGGTYIHSDAIVHFLRYLSVEFAVKCDLYIKHKIQEAHDELITTKATIKANKANEAWTITRETGKATRRSLTDTIKMFCKYAEDSREAPYKDSKCPYYLLLSKMVYDVLKLKRPKGKKPLRDIFSAPIVTEIKHMEDKLIGLINEVIVEDMEYHKAFKYIKNEMKLNKLRVADR